MGRVGASTPLRLKAHSERSFLRVQVRPSDPRRRMHGRCGPRMAPALCYCREQTHRGHVPVQRLRRHRRQVRRLPIIDGLLQRAAED